MSTQGTNRELLHIHLVNFHEDTTRIECLQVVMAVAASLLLLLRV